MGQNRRPCVPRRSVQIELAAPTEPQVAGALGIRVLGAHVALGFRGVFVVLGVDRAHPGTLSALGMFGKLGVPSARCVLLGTFAAWGALGCALGCVNNLEVAQYKWLVQMPIRPVHPRLRTLAVFLAYRMCGTIFACLRDAGLDCAIGRVSHLRTAAVTPLHCTVACLRAADLECAVGRTSHVPRIGAPQGIVRTHYAALVGVRRSLRYATGLRRSTLLLWALLLKLTRQNKHCAAGLP